MNKLLHRTLMAYRPLYLHALLMDGQYRLLTTSAPATTDTSDTPQTRQRSLLAALTQIVFPPRSK
ncbi:hypothetical protein PY254_02330 [Rhodanobacter sp. AS-Z3]|uniref:hypothetical protein n=1 Tax=Rhodanobacter sp. AS-Z3 TaxID=3031330 RepID=UPI0024799C7B|nr:hypothetical protein [Rhodanobacter sp. AS-Z3]WEN15537.1 hypothetical protein PY254_02330 [Rhodanobacter sp. AS-Z3]